MGVKILLFIIILIVHNLISISFGLKVGKILLFLGIT